MYCCSDAWSWLKGVFYDVSLNAFKHCTISTQLFVGNQCCVSKLKQHYWFPLVFLSPSHNDLKLLFTCPPPAHTPCVSNSNTFCLLLSLKLFFFVHFDKSETCVNGGCTGLFSGESFRLGIQYASSMWHVFTHIVTRWQ